MATNSNELNVTAEANTRSLSNQNAENKKDEENYTIQLNNQDTNKANKSFNRTNQYSSLELDSAKALLTKEYSGLQRKKLTDMLLNAKTTITPYLDHFGEPEKVMHGAIVPTRIVSLMIMDKSCRR